MLKLVLEMRAGKHKVGKETPRILFEKWVLSRLNKRVRNKYEVRGLKKIVLNVNNFCDLACFSCVSLCDTKMGANVWRDRPRTMAPDVLDRALAELVRAGPYQAVFFAGGEPTAIPLEDLEELASIVRKHGLKSIILTNGYAVEKLDPHVFDYFVLDDHGINQEAIERSVAHLENHNFPWYHIILARVHFNFRKAFEEPVITPGVHCPAWMVPTLWLDLVYPCCFMPQMEGWDNDTVIRDALAWAGWTVENPSLAETLINWRETIPGAVIKKCLFRCWKYREAYEERNIVEERRG